MTGQAERFQIFLGILDPGDYEFVERRDAGLARQFRRNRTRIFRQELRQIRREAGELYRLRASNIAEAGQWQEYAPLLRDTALSYLAIAKLGVAARLFALNLPRMINAARNAERVQRFVTSQTLATSHASQTA